MVGLIAEKHTHFHDFQLKYLQCPYRRKSHIAEIAGAFEVCIKNYSECINNDVIFQDWISEPFWIFLWSCLVKYLTLHILVFFSFESIMKAFKNWQNFLHYDFEAKIFVYIGIFPCRWFVIDDSKKICI